MSKDRLNVRDSAAATVTRRPDAKSGATLKGVYEFRCVGPDGELKWEDTAENLVTNAALTSVLDVYLSSATQITTWFVGLTDDSPTPAAGDTMSSHGGWTEFTEYTEANRVAYADGGASAQSIDNSGTPASFAINNDTNGGLGGAFIVSNNTKGGTTGTLFSVVALTGGNRVVNDGDTVEVTYTVSAADDGA